MKTHVLIAFLFPAILFISCEKDMDSDSNPSPTPPPHKDYGQLKVGNYWIYERFNVDSSGNATTQNVFDSCFVEKDTMISGKKYFKMVRPNPFTISQYDIYYLKDSLHYIVHSDGKILFSYVDFTTIFDTYYITVLLTDTICEIIQKMDDMNESVTVPAGTYVTMNSKITYYFQGTWTNNGSVRSRSLRFAENIGIVAETFPFYTSNPNYNERWMVRYHLE